MTGSNRIAVVATEGWFDGARHQPGPVTFLVDSGRISSIRPGDDRTGGSMAGRELITGGFVLPGLVDSHAHLFLDGGSTDGAMRSVHMKKPHKELIETGRISARHNLAAGVTLVRDAGDKHGVNHAIRSEAENGAGDMCRVRSAGIGIRRPKRYGAFMAREVTDAETIRAAVVEIAENADEIKMILTGIIDFEAGVVTDEPQFDLDAAKTVAQTAKAAGLKTLVHCSGPKGLAIAARAGFDSIEHGFFMDRETLAVMRDNDVAWTPTFCPVHFQWQVPNAVGWSDQTVGNLRRILDSHAEHLSLAYEMGVSLLLGTDAGSMGVEHGKAVIEEIRRFVEAGLPLTSVLASATSIPRRHFELPHSVLSEGAPFEAVLLDESPFDDLANLKTPCRVWLGSNPHIARRADRAR